MKKRFPKDVVAYAEANGFRLLIIQQEYAEDPRNWDNLGTMVCFHKRYDLGDKHDYRSHRDFLESLVTEVCEFNDEALLKLLEEKFGELYELKYDEEKWIICERGYEIEEYDTQEEAEERLQEIKEELFEQKLYYLDWLDDDELMFIIEQNAVILPLYLYDHSGLIIRTYPFSCPWDSGQVGWIYATHEKIKEEFGKINEETLKKTEEILRTEVKEYNHYINGDVYGYVLQRIKVCPQCNQEVIEEIDSCFGFYGDWDDLKENGLPDVIPAKYHYLLDKLESVY